MSAFPIPLTLRGGEEGVLEGWDGAFLLVRVPMPFAPGTPVRVLISLPTPLPFEGKSLGSKLGDDGLFTMRLRPVTLPKSTRVALDALRDA
ncbi:MAG: hypothetical protein IPL19_17725 [Sandaracinaceae bacterium]|nr:hypothetical protein [Sandaracinaceae bacterium]MBP7681907.1 hypothetical protein [Deltaproteobacteria bacterium]